MATGKTRDNTLHTNMSDGMESKDPWSWSVEEVELYLSKLFPSDDQQRKAARILNVRQAGVDGRFLVGTVIEDEVLMRTELHLSKLQAQRLVVELRAKAQNTQQKTPKPHIRASNNSSIETPATPEMEEMKTRLAHLESILQMSVANSRSPAVRNISAFQLRLENAAQQWSTADTFGADSVQATPEKRREDIVARVHSEGSHSASSSSDEADELGSNDALEKRLERLRRMAMTRKARMALSFEDSDPSGPSPATESSPIAVASPSAVTAVLSELTAAGQSIWVVGGWDGHAVVNSVERFNAHSRQWAGCNPLAASRRGAAVAASGSQVFAVGGWSGSGYLRHGEVLDLSGCEVGQGPEPHWSPLPPLPHPTCDAAAAACGAQLYVLGGGTGAASPRVQVMQVPWRVWEEGPRMRESRSRLAAVAVGSVVYAIGGCSKGRVLSSVEMLDTNCPQLGWKPAGCLSCPRQSHAAVAVGQRIYVLGGFDGCRHLASVEVLEVQAGGWRVVSCMQVPRSDFAAVALGESIVAVGGAAAASHLRLASVEVWRPRSAPSDRWRYLNGLRAPRSAFGAAVG